MQSPALNAAGLISVYTEQWAERQSSHSRAIKRRVGLLQQLSVEQGWQQLGLYWTWPGTAWAGCRDSCTADGSTVVRGSVSGSPKVLEAISLSDRGHVKLLMEFCTWDLWVLFFTEHWQFRKKGKGLCSLIWNVPDPQTFAWT